MPTSENRRMTSCRASLRDRPRCRRRGSAVCMPTLSTGLSEVMGSWKIMARWRPRRARISSGGMGAQVTAAEQDTAG